MNPLRAGIIGMTSEGRLLAQELSHAEAYAFVALADRDKDAADKVASEYQVAAYDDYRRLLVEVEMDVVFLAAPTWQLTECLPPAAQNVPHIVKSKPLGRNLPEAKQFTDMTAKTNRRFFVSAPWRFLSAYRHVKDILAQNRIGDVYLAHAECFTDLSAQLDWRGDPILAGGGALLHAGYCPLDMLMWLFGAPERIYGLSTAKCSKRVLPPSRTEDAAALLMRFSEGVTGAVQCGWMVGIEREGLRIFGTEGAIEADAAGVKCLDASGQPQERYRCKVKTPAQAQAEELTHIAACIADSQIKAVSPAVDHLPLVAVIDSAYLSTRTQMSETMKLYDSIFDRGAL
ncbi:MAG: Gfo/Idh/MocA family oxidoreductase [Sedimentisphaerales bacterium]|nr:Gfo/Idh/MocA family oxidoreductase [Sedimentisphaerales bacterium]